MTTTAGPLDTTFTATLAAPERVTPGPASSFPTQRRSSAPADSSRSPARSTKSPSVARSWPSATERTNCRSTPVADGGGGDDVGAQLRSGARDQNLQRLGRILGLLVRPQPLHQPGGATAGAQIAGKRREQSAQPAAVAGGHRPAGRSWPCAGRREDAAACPRSQGRKSTCAESTSNGGPALGPAWIQNDLLCSRRHTRCRTESMLVLTGRATQ